jgi:hypothetical protein
MVLKEESGDVMKSWLALTGMIKTECKHIMHERNFLIKIGG